MSGQPAQTKTIRSQLLADMKDGAYASCERLPRESVLAEKLGISRTQLRDILASLEREGFITRRHGVGTIINRHVLNVQTRMDIEVEFLDMIRQSGHEPAVAFVRYPFSFLALIDLLAILPSLTMLNNSFKLLRILLMARSLRVLRAFKALRYSRSVRLLLNVFRSSKDPLITVGTLAAAYVVISALVIFNVEPQSFDTFFDAIYWAAVTLTTVGYGDIYPVTAVGRTIAVVSSVFGVAIVALPAGILTAGYMNELRKERQDQERD